MTPTPANPAKKSRFKVDMTPVSNYSPKPFEFLWEDRIARNSTAVLVGRGGVGKTLVMESTAAALSRGYDVDAYTKGFLVKSETQGRTLYITNENDPERVLRPRFDALGGDSTQLLFANPPFGFVSPEKVQALEDAIIEAKPLLVVIDPCESYMEKLNPNGFVNLTWPLLMV